jgi:peptide/nickel transport system substrate-binding protein
MATAGAELVKLPRLLQGHQASREEGKKLLQEGGQSNLKFQLWNRNLAMPYTPGRASSWSTSGGQIGVEVEHKQSDTRPYLAHMNAGNHDVAIDFSNLFMDDSSLGLRSISRSRARRRTARATRTPSSTRSMTITCANAIRPSARR